MLSDLYSKFTPYEWILSNRLGGYALGTAFLSNVRKYHGLLIAGYDYGRRYHLVSSVEEQVIFPSGLSYQLDTNFYRDTIYPEGYRLIKDFFYRPYPRFIFYCPERGDAFLEKTLRFHAEKNILLLTYTNISTYPFKLTLRPKLTFRNHHTLNSSSFWRECEFESFGESAFVAKDELALFIYLNRGQIYSDPLFYYAVYYPLEELRGYPAYEDLFSPFKIEVELAPKESLKILFSDQITKNIEQTIDQIEKRYANYPQLKVGEKTFSEELLESILEQMLRDFLLDDDVIAGYPWFYCWGRDTFIGLPAIFHLKEGKDLAMRVFLNYGSKIKNGLIPNVVGTPDETNYNSLDGTLWFLLRIFEYLNCFKRRIKSEDKKQLLLLIETVLEEFLSDHGHPFIIDQQDGLIEILESSNLALTWMDVVIDGKPITPRYGKPIEISALWLNILQFSLLYLKKSFLKKFKIEELFEKAKLSFGRYFGSSAIADRLSRGEPIFEIRPNFVIALSLPFIFVEREHLALAERIVRAELLTPFGLRSLSPRHPSFKRKYFGTQYQRDLAYHNGTVWVWLLYPYAQMLKKLLSKEEYLITLERLLHPFKALVLSGRVGSIPEIYDGDNPHYPKGAPAQFWSVAGIFLLVKDLKNLTEGDRK